MSSRSHATPGDVTPAAIVSINGRVLPPDAPALSAFERGFLLADGVFETMRALDFVPFRLDAHLARLHIGAGVLQLALPPRLDAMVLGTLEHARANGLRDAAVRLTVSRGCGEPGLMPPVADAPTAAARATVVIAVRPLDPLMRTDGVTAHFVAGQRNPRARTAGIKSLSYTESIVALLDARAAGADDALLLDTDGHLSGGASSNVFLVLGDTLVTPPRECGILPGITRAIVLDIAAAERIAVQERVVMREEVAFAGEAFLTSSLRGIAPLLRVNGDAIGNGIPGAVTRRVRDAYATLVQRECRAGPAHARVPA